MGYVSKLIFFTEDAIGMGRILDFEMEQSGLCNIRQRNDFSVEVKPLPLAIDQVESQSMLGWFSSALHNLRDLDPLASVCIVTLFSTKTLYQSPDFKLDSLRSPSSLTSLMSGRTPLR